MLLGEQRIGGQKRGRQGANCAVNKTLQFRVHNQADIRKAAF